MLPGISPSTRRADGPLLRASVWPSLKDRTWSRSWFISACGGFRRVPKGSGGPHILIKSSPTRVMVGGLLLAGSKRKVWRCYFSRSPLVTKTLLPSDKVMAVPMEKPNGRPAASLRCAHLLYRRVQRGSVTRALVISVPRSGDTTVVCSYFVFRAITYSSQ